MKVQNRYALKVWMLATLMSSMSQAQWVAVKSESKWKYVSLIGQELPGSPYEDAGTFRQGYAVVKLKDAWQVIDEKGKLVWGPRKQPIRGEVNSRRIVAQDDLGKWGAVDLRGKTTSAFQYDAMAAFQSGVAIAGKKTTNPDVYQALVVDTVGNEVISFDNLFLPSSAYDNNIKVREGFVSVLVSGSYESNLTKSQWQIDNQPLYYVVLDVRRKQLINARVNSFVPPVREGRLNLAMDGISYSWSLPVPVDLAANAARFSYFSPSIFGFSGGIAAVVKDGKWAYLDKDGSLLSETNLSTTDFFSEDPLYSSGFVVFRKTDGSFIYTDLNGKQKITNEFERAEPFSGSVAVVKVKGKWGVIQKDGTFVIPAQYEEIRY